jgi:hypothetical protein
VIGVESGIDDGGNHPLGIVVKQCLFEHALAGARFAEHQTEAAPLGVDAEDVEDFLLMGQKREGLRVEGVPSRPKWERIIMGSPGWGCLFRESVFYH